MDSLRDSSSKQDARQCQILRRGLSALGRNGRRVGFPQGGDTLGGNWWKDKLDVALPKIKTQVGAVFTDTVFIRSDSMKVRDSLVVSLAFLRDSNNAQLSVNDKVDTLGLGYKYKSRWKANVGVKPDSFYRQFPANSLTYRKWNKVTANCGVGFNRDSLYAIGGKLTIECKGKLKPIPNINNSFKVDTDTLAANGIDTLQTKRILIDRDPPNASFLAALQDTIIKAIAWVEYAGSNDNTHCHNPLFNPQWNHYWDDRINGADTCRDTKTPCENRQWTDTGIMQIIRLERGDTIHGWENWFRRADNLPPDYRRVTWDSLAWNWKINIFNGKYIHDIYMPAKFKPEQQAFPESCSFADCDTFPTKKNKEDLKSYGYHRGDPEMRKITNDAKWKESIADTLHHYEYSIYVQNVRKYTYRRPWQ